MSDRGWLAAQGAVVLGVIVAVPLFGAIVGWPLARPAPASIAAGGILIAAGAALALAAVRAMGASFRARPTPPPNGRLIETGPFGRVRHPIYSGVLLAAVGYLAVWPTPSGAAAVVAAAVFFSAKAKHEEELLSRRHPGYADYARRVRHRLIPGVR